jgi:hypothetical protein
MTDEACHPQRVISEWRLCSAFAKGVTDIRLRNDSLFMVIIFNEYGLAKLDYDSYMTQNSQFLPFCKTYDTD